MWSSWSTSESLCHTVDTCSALFPGLLIFTFPLTHISTVYSPRSYSLLSNYWSPNSKSLQSYSIWNSVNKPLWTTCLGKSVSRCNRFPIWRRDHISRDRSRALVPPFFPEMFFITEVGEPALMKLHENPFTHHIEHPGRLETIEDVAKEVRIGLFGYLICLSWNLTLLVTIPRRLRSRFFLRIPRNTSTLWPPLKLSV